jgi:pSer/pThr/pTyr-binding forkhead associated (FHA) protein
MQDVTIRFASGPMSGESGQYELGAVLLGREPRPEPGQQSLVLRGADGSVSRSHALISDRDGKVVLTNISGNGTRVDGNLVMEEIVLKPGSTIAIGGNHEFGVEWQVVSGRERADQATGEKKQAKVTSSGPLASPLVRALLAVYLVGLVAVAGWLSWRGDGRGDIGDDWPELARAYADYEAPGVDEEEKARRARLAQAMLVRLRVLRVNERDRDVEKLCREMMRIDADTRSPIYRYGAKCLGSTQ